MTEAFPFSICCVFSVADKSTKEVLPSQLYFVLRVDGMGGRTKMVEIGNTVVGENLLILEVYRMITKNAMQESSYTASKAGKMGIMRKVSRCGCVAVV